MITIPTESGAKNTLPYQFPGLCLTSLKPSFKQSFKLHVPEEDQDEVSFDLKSIGGTDRSLDEDTQFRALHTKTDD